MKAPKSLSHFDCLLIPVVFHHPITVIQLFIEVIPAPLLRGKGSELAWTVHLVGVKLVWTPVLVLVGLRLNAFVESVSGLEAKFFIPIGKLILAHSEDPNVA